MSHTIGQAKQDTQQSNSNSNESPQDTPLSEAVSPEPKSGLSDADYEFLFNQLLEGVAHGWHDHRIIKFFKQLGDRGQQSDWVAWLERLRIKLLKLPIQSKRQLGTMMIRLGELTQSTTQVNQIGAASHRIGRELLFGNTPAVIWEYAGPDLSSETKGVETEQELSARLPDDFSDLGRDEADEAEDLESAQTDQPELLLADQSSDDELLDNLWFDDDSEPESTDNPSVLDHEEVTVTLENHIEDAVNPVSEIVLEENKLDLNLEPELESEPLAETVSTTSGVNLELELNYEQNDSAQVASYGEEFEFELDHEPVNEESSSSKQSEFPEKSSSQGNAADLSPELPISAPNGLSNALQSFVLESDADTPELAAIEMSETTSLLVEEESKQQNNLASEQQSEMVSSQIAENQELTQELDDSSLELIESWFNLGLKQVSVGEYDKAIASWDKALTINANLSEAWHNRGSALGRLGHYEAAVTSFQNALAIDPDNYQAWNDRAHALYQLENWSGAIESWSQAIKIMPGNHLFWYNRGCALEQLEKWQDAIASYEKALEIKPDFQPGRSRYINLVADDSRPN